MSKSIIAALRHHAQLHGSLLLAATELAHRADGRNGHVCMSYSLLAAKCHQSRRTAIRHIHRLLDLGIIACQRFWQPGGKWLVNKYVFLIKWERPTPAPAQKSSGDTLTPIFPKAEKEGEKYGRLRDEKDDKRTVLSWLTNPHGVLGTLLADT